MTLLLKQNGEFGFATLTVFLGCIGTADLLLHVVDISHPDFEDQIKVVEKTLADLGCADLSYANFAHANLINVSLRDANLTCANLVGANLDGASLNHANLIDASLGNASLRNANFCNANLKGATFGGADFRNANLYDAIDVPYMPMACPEKGSFIGYKKAHVIGKSGSEYAVIVELEICEDARRSSATGRKCRCDKAKVISISTPSGSRMFDFAYSNYDGSFIYRVGEIVEEPNFDENRFKECAAGIHFFIGRQEAVDY